MYTQILDYLAKCYLVIIELRNKASLIIIKVKNIFGLTTETKIISIGIGKKSNCIKY